MKEKLLNQAKKYYENNCESKEKRLQRQAENKYREVSNKDKDKKREY